MVCLRLPCPRKPSREAPLELGPPYCSDPDCEYCKELRAALEKMKRDNARNSRAQAHSTINPRSGQGFPKKNLLQTDR
jgi:hypothetical protein